MGWREIKALKEKHQELTNKGTEIFNRAKNEKRSMTEEETKQFDGIMGEADQVFAEHERENRLEGARSAFKDNIDRANSVASVSVSDSEENAEQIAKVSKRARNEWYRFGNLVSDEARKHLRFQQFTNSEALSQRSTVTVGGIGIVGDRTVYDQLVVNLKSHSAVRRAGATIIPSSTGNPQVRMTRDDTGNLGKIVDEDVQNATQTAPTYANKTLTPKKYTSEDILISVEGLQDSTVDIEADILACASERIARATGAHFATGNGTTQPEGFVTAATVGKTGASSQKLTAEEIMALIYAVDESYHALPSFRISMSATTYAHVRTLKDGSGRYIWNPPLGSAPATISDFPVIVNNDMASIGTASARVMAAGAMSYYEILDVTSPYIIRDEYTYGRSGMVSFIMLSRHDGKLLNTAAVKVLVSGASS